MHFECRVFIPLLSGHDWKELEHPHLLLWDLCFAPSAVFLCLMFPNITSMGRQLQEKLQGWCSTLLQLLWEFCVVQKEEWEGAEPLVSLLEQPQGVSCWLGPCFGMVEFPFPAFWVGVSWWFTLFSMAAPQRWDLLTFKGTWWGKLDWRGRTRRGFWSSWAWCRDVFHQAFPCSV